LRYSKTGRDILKQTFKPLFAGLLSSISAVMIGAPITVNNASFETANPLNQICTGTNCAFNTAVIPSWTASGSASGSFRPGNPANNVYFSTIPDGSIVAYSNGGSLEQTVTPTAVAGFTYTLQVDLGNRFEQNFAASIALVIGSNSVTGIGVVPVEGGWSTYTAAYTATAADAGQAITIRLISSGPQGNFDNVRLDGTMATDPGGPTIPEPQTYALMGFGLAAIALIKRNR
jgi:hypothetical protein